MENNNQKSFEDNHYFSENTDIDNLSAQELDSLLETEEIIFQSIHHDSELYLQKLTADPDFACQQEQADIQRAEKKLATPSDTFTLPEYLKNYVNLELNRKPVLRDSIVVKLFNRGTKFIQSSFQESTLCLLPEVVTSVRSAGVAERVPAIMMEEQIRNEDRISYQIIKESHNQAYLAVKFKMDKNPYSHVTLKKNDRMIFSNSINDNGMMNFSGLGEGIYSIEFIGDKATKSFDLKILVD